MLIFALFQFWLQRWCCRAAGRWSWWGRRRRSQQWADRQLQPGSQSGAPLQAWSVPACQFPPHLHLHPRCHHTSSHAYGETPLPPLTWPDLTWPLSISDEGCPQAGRPRLFILPGRTGGQLRLPPVLSVLLAAVPGLRQPGGSDQGEREGGSRGWE